MTFRVGLLSRIADQRASPLAGAVSGQAARER